MVNMTPLDAVELTAIGILVIVLVVALFWLSMRIDALEIRMNAGPSHDDMRVIHNRLAEFSGQLVGIASRVDASAQMIGTIQSHLMDKVS